MHLGLNQVHGLILGLVFQVGGLGVSGARVMSPNWTRVTSQFAVQAFSACRSRACAGSTAVCVHNTALLSLVFAGITDILT
jgi:hypothetical protein